jgi:hypothetical protein
MIDKLWTKLVGKISDLAGHDAGLWMGDYNNNNIKEPSKRVIEPRVNMNSVLVQPPRMNQLGYTDVNRDALATIICPERNVSRYPRDYPAKTGLIAGSTSFVATTDAAGNVLVLINPDNILVTAAASSTTSFFALTTLTGFVPATGAFTTETFINGPVSASAAQVESMQLVGFSVIATPITSVNNSSGTVHYDYLQNQNNTGPVSGIYPLSAIQTQPFYQTGNTSTTYRGVHVPDQFDQAIIPNGAATFEEGWYIALVGGPISTNVLNIECHYVFEAIPSPGQVQLTVMDYAVPGVATTDCVANMFYALPAIAYLTLDDAYALANHIRNANSCRFDDVMAAILNFVQGYKPVHRKAGTSQSQIQRASDEEEIMSSFDF